MMPRPPYAKLYRSIFDGTLGPPAPPYGWQVLTVMLLNCSVEGVVDMTPEVIALRSGMPLEAVREGIRMLEAPDPQSRTPGSGGCRIARLEAHRTWGWRIVNYGLYRASTDAERAREYRLRQGDGLRESERERKMESRGGVRHESVTGRHGANHVLGMRDEVQASLPNPTSGGLAPEQPDLPGMDSETREGRPPSPVRLDGGADRDGEPEPVLTLLLRGCGLYAVGADEVARLTLAHPEADVPHELPKMAAWLMANPSRRKTRKGMPRFLNSWLARSAEERRSGHRASTDSEWLRQNRQRLEG
jgi:hypothetical protein